MTSTHYGYNHHCCCPLSSTHPEEKREEGWGGSGLMQGSSMTGSKTIHTGSQKDLTRPRQDSRGAPAIPEPTRTSIKVCRRRADRQTAWLAPLDYQPGATRCSKSLLAKEEKKGCPPPVCFIWPNNGPSLTERGRMNLERPLATVAIHPLKRWGARFHWRLLSCKRAHRSRLRWACSS